LDSHLKALNAKGDPLEVFEALVPFEYFRAEAVVSWRPRKGRATPAFQALLDETITRIWSSPGSNMNIIPLKMGIYRGN
jgi:hypothetical protein